LMSYGFERVTAALPSERIRRRTGPNNTDPGRSTPISTAVFTPRAD
jgi:hypothetical protein